MVYTDTVQIVTVPLPSGANAAVLYSVNIGDILICLLLVGLLLLQAVQMWRVRRTVA